jgi:hypothetical protein
MLRGIEAKTSAWAASAAQNTAVPPTRFRKKATRKRPSTTP